jgi:hypothetical protein
MTALPYLVLSTVRKALFPAANEVAIAEEAFTPLDLSRLRHLPRETDRSASAEAAKARAQAANRFAVQPPPVPFNYPNA